MPISKGIGAGLLVWLSVVTVDNCKCKYTWYPEVIVHLHDGYVLDVVLIW